MNMLTNIKPTEAPTMSSREIAKLTGKRHDNVMADIRKMLAELEPTDLLTFQVIEKDGRNRDQPVYRLPKRETLILVSGYSVELRARIIDRWQELEEAQRAPAPTFDPAMFYEMMAQMTALVTGQIEENRAFRASMVELVSSLQKPVAAPQALLGAPRSLVLR